MTTWPDGMLDLLDTVPTLALGTVDADGRPRVSPVFALAVAAEDRLSLYWLSSPHAHHSAAIGRTGRAAGALYPDVSDWRLIRGLQVEGPAAAVGDPLERQAALSLYRERLRLSGDLAPLIEAATLYRLAVEWACWLDNAVAFGHKVELRLPPRA